MMSTNTLTSQVTPVVILLGLAGCTSTEPATDRMAAAQQALEQARMAQAHSHAPAEMRQAEMKLEQAEAAMAAEDYDQARRLAEQALVDADLADATADSEVTQRNLDELQVTIEALRREAFEAPTTQ